MIATLLLAALLDFGPERELVPRPPAGLAAGQRERARVATSDSGSLVIWSDLRTNVWDVYAARLDRAGALLDERGLLIASGVPIAHPNGPVFAPGVAGDVLWTGRAYLVAYSIHPIVYVRTVTAEGVLGAPIPIVDVEWVEAHTVRLATDGETVLLMTNSGRGAVLTLDGEKRRELNFGVLRRAEFGLDIAVSNDAYGLATIVQDGVEDAVAFRRIHADSDEAAQILPGSSGATTVALGSDGTDFLAAYDSTAGTVPLLRTLRVGDAATHDLTGFAAAFPKIVWRGSDYLITFTRTANVDALAVRASPAGQPLGEPVMFATATPPSQPDADRRPDGTGVAAWVSGYQRVEVGFFDTADAAPSDVEPISFAPPDQRYVHVAAQGGDIYTMWLESQAGLAAVRLGRGPGGPAVTLATGGEMWPIDVLVDGDVVWAVWNESLPGVLVQRFTRSLLPIDDAPLRVTLHENAPYEQHRTMRLAAGGGTLLCVGPESGDNEPGVQVSVVREANGALTADLLFLKTAYRSRTLAAAWNGNEFVIAWALSQDEWVWWMAPVAEHLVAQRIGADGVLRDAAPVTIIGEPGRAFDALRSVRSGNDVVLIWQSSPVGLPSIPTRDTFAARISSPEPHPIDNPLRRRLRAVTMVGDQFLTLWTQNLLTHDDDVESVLLSHDLREVERGPVPVPADDFDLASTWTRPVLGYSRVAEEHGRVLRAFIRTTPLPRNRAVRR